MAIEPIEINTPLYQRVGQNLYLLNIQTTAKQVKMQSEEGQSSDAQAEIEALRKKIAGLLSANDAMIFKGVVSQDSDIPGEGYEAGWTYKAAAAGEYKGQACEVGDLIVCVKDYAEAGDNEDWTVIQTNIEGAVTGPSEAEEGNLAAFSGMAGRVIADSSLKKADVQAAIEKSHEHSNKEDVLDKLTVQDGMLKFDGKGINDGLVEVAFSDSIETIPSNLREGGLLVVQADA